MKITSALLFLGTLTALYAAEPRIFTTRTVTAAIPPDTINYEGAPTNSQATVHLRVYGAGDSVLLGGSEADVFFVVDNSTSMGGRNPGAGFVQPPPAISFTQGAYNAAVNFIDSFMVAGNNRVGGLLFDWYMPLIAPLTSPTQDPGLLGVKDSFDQMLGQPGTWDDAGKGSKIYDGLDSAITYMQINARPNVQKIIILVTDGDNFWSTKTLADNVNRLNAINATATDIQVYCIDIGQCGDVLSQNMIDIAAAGRGTAAFTCLGTDIDSIFQGIGQKFSSIAAYKLSSGAPMVVDVFGPGIHLVPNSIVFDSTPGHMIPPITIDFTPTGLTRISFHLDTVRLGREMEVEYKITGAITAPSLTPALMRTNNSQGDDPTYYSVAQYNRYNGIPTSQPVDKTSLYVKSGVGGLKLSMSPSNLIAPSATGSISLPYTVTTPAKYPATASADTFWYALIQLLGTNVAVYSQAAQASWYFNPDIAWSALRFNNDVGGAKKVGVTVAYDHPGSYPLRVQAAYGGVTYRDSVIFSATNATTENIARVGVDDDTTQPPATLDTIFITGNYNELTNPAYSKLLLGRGITTLGNSWPVNATWSASGFSLFNLSSSITGTGTTKLLTFGTPTPVYTNTPRNDAGVINVTYNSMTGQLVVIIHDTTNYDTVEAVVVVPDGPYRAATVKNGLYSYAAPQPSNVNYGTFAGDTLKFSALLFDVDAGGSTGKFLGAGGFPYNSQRVSWFRNGSPMAGVDSTIAVSSGVPGSRDTLVAVWGSVRDTIFVNWNFGRQRFLRIETAAGVVGTANAAPVDSLIFNQATPSQTAYAVIRDEFGFCVSNADLEFWRFVPVSSVYLQAPPSDSLTSVFVINKISSPASEQRYSLIAQLPPQQVSGVAVAQLEDTVLVKMVQYTYVAIRIVADSSNHWKDAFNTGVWNKLNYGSFTTSYRRNTPIGADTVKVVALDDSVVLRVQLQHSDNASLWDTVAVSWTLSNYAWQSQASFGVSDRVTLRPTSRGNVVQLTATYPGGLSTSIYVLVEAARIDTFITQFPPVPVIAGDTVPLTIQAIDVAGNPVTDPTRVPTQVCYTVSGPVVIHVGNIDTLVNGTFCVNSPFSNGTLQTLFTPYTTGTIHVTVEVQYPNGSGTSTYTTNFDLPVIPGPPSTVVIVRKGDTTAVGVDTLSPIGTSTVREYEALVFDAYGNPITDPAVLAHLTWSMTGALPGGPQNLGSFSNTASYNAYGLTAGGLGTLTATYNFNSIVVTDNAQLYVIPLVGISYLSTHEWVMDTLSGLSTAEWVLKEVGGVDPATLIPGVGESRNILILRGLRSLGYQSLRDGFLDYLDIQLSDSLTLREAFLKSLWFSTIIRPGLSDAETLTVSWALTGSVGGRAVQSRLESLDLGKTKYRLWLLPNSVVSGSHLETGFKPHITFDNDAVRAANPSNPHPRLIGTGGALYTTSAGQVIDSAASVIHKFLLQNNACNPSNPLNRVKITFSEPVKSSQGDITLTHSALALFNGASGDSAFVPQALTDVQGTIETVDPFLAWELDPASDFITLLSGTVKFAYNGLFTPNTSRIRFARDLTLTPVVDAAGNIGTVVANREVTLENEKVFNEVCNLSGNTVVDRIEASTYSWIPVPGSTTEMAPGFPYFGFTVNLGLVDRTDQNVEVKTCAAQNFVVYDYDSAMAFVQTDVTVFDLFGNLVATPQSNPTLLKPYTVSEVRRYLGIDFSIVCGESSDSLEKKYDRTDAVDPADPDTLRPKYPGTFSVDYSFMVQNCGPNSAEKMCVPAWNALNLKGRLVAPGGYIAVQRIVTPGHTEEVVRKLIVTSKERR